MVQDKLTRYINTHVNVEDSLKKLYEKIQRCNNCELSKLEVNKFRPYLKMGTKPILIISQNPSIFRSELPYVWGGLDKLLKNLPPKRAEELVKVLEKVYVTNICKCSTPQNRAPKKSEINACLKWLQREVEIISPLKIIVLGSIARDGLKGKFETIPKRILEHPISAIRQGLTLDYSYRLEEAIIG